MNEYEEEIEPKYIVKPKFSILYELIMPTGRKIKNSLLAFFSVLILIILFNLFKGYINLNDVFGNLDINSIINIIFIILLVVICIKTTIHIVFQVLQYKYLSYSFFDDYMIYEDSFLNQHRKTIQYNNIKEVEIRRTITDRILGYGIIVIYTNAENSSNGLVIYSIKNPQECYDRIQSIIKRAKHINKSDNNIYSNSNEYVEKDVNEKPKTKIDNEDAEEISKIVDLSIEDQEKFNESLKNINNE